MSDRLSPILTPESTGRTRLLILRLAWVDLVDPVEHAALEVQHVLEPHRSEEIGRLCASAAHLAMDDDLFLGVEFGVPPRYIAQRNQLRTWNTVDLVFVRLADIDNPQFVAPVEPLFQLDGGNLEIILGRSHSSWLRFGRSQAAELFVVDQVGHGWMRAAHRAVWILPELQLAESHPQRVVNQEASDQRLADAGDELDRFGRLNHTNHTWQHAEHAAFGAARDQTGRGRLRVQAPIAGALFRPEHGGLAFEPENAA